MSEVELLLALVVLGMIAYGDYAAYAKSKRALRSPQESVALYTKLGKNLKSSEFLSCVCR